MSAAVASSTSAGTPPLSPPADPPVAAPEVFTLHVTRFTLIETAEETSQWASRAKDQWGGSSKPITIGVTSQSVKRGSTVARSVTYSGKSQGWTGIEWGRGGEGIVVPLPEDPMLLIEVCAAKHPNRPVAVGVLDAQAMLAEGRQFAKYCVHLFQLHAAQDDDTVHALVEVEVHSSLLDDPPEDNFLPLEYNYGSVRVSTVDFYYLPFLLNGSGQYVVSNVMCAMNMTESSSLAMQLVPLKEAANYLLPNPSKVITVRPQQRVYFSASYVISQKACMRPMELQLTVNGSQPPSAPIIIKAHVGTPQPTATDIAYHYWVNTTCITNRQMMPSQELPLIRAILPVYRFIANGPINQTEGMIVAFDKDKGEQVLVSASGVPVAMSSSASYGGGGGVGGGVGGAGGYGSGGFNAARGFGGDLGFLAGGGGALDGMNLTAGNLGDLLGGFTLDANASFVVQDSSRGHRNLLPSRGPLLNLSQKTCLCTIVLGTIRGFPMVFETATGISPSFQVSITLLDQQGWQIVKGETLPSYQSASGSLRWTEQLILRKWPGAKATQFMRLNLTEVRPHDSDETPIGAGLISLSSMLRTYALNPMSVAFYVYETYSLYDQLNSPSLLMRDVNLIFSDIR